mmetsp:Transcript_56547/g.132097  ORF Transcript_56547/g.132097 Transcript_56547/m.132097 type:complete len:216 (-) Transcript_56547:193-840(-)
METVFSEAFFGVSGSSPRRRGSSAGVLGSSFDCSGGTSTWTCLAPAARAGMDFIVRNFEKGMGLPPNAACCIRRSMRSNRCRTYSRRSTMSMTLALLPPRSRSTTSRNSWKESFRKRRHRGVRLGFGDGDSSSHSSSSSFSVGSSNKTSLRLMRSETLTPKRVNTKCISGFRISSSNSSRWICRSLSLSWHSKISSKVFLRYATAASSFSFKATW